MNYWVTITSKNCICRHCISNKVVRVFKIQILCKSSTREGGGEGWYGWQSLPPVFHWILVPYQQVRTVCSPPPPSKNIENGKGKYCCSVHSLYSSFFCENSLYFALSASFTKHQCRKTNGGRGGGGRKLTGSGKLLNHRLGKLWLMYTCSLYAFSLFPGHLSPVPCPLLLVFLICLFSV